MNIKETVEIGKDMFDNDIVIGQHVLFNRADPGGVGIGVVTNIERYKSDKPDGKVFSMWGHEYFNTRKKDFTYYYTIKTRYGRETTKRDYQIIGKFDNNIGYVFNNLKYENG
jgi:hypothetical protein